MEWPNFTSYASLFPSFAGEQSIDLPNFDTHSPVWKILDPKSPNSLQKQLLQLIEHLSTTEKFEQVNVTIDETKGRVIIDPSAIIEPSTHFIGPCYVGPEAIIRHGSYIRENSWICTKALVGHCSEIKHSILLPGSKAPHFNYVGDSILGKGVNLGAGAKLSNLRNDGGEVFLRIEGKRIASGLRKFGAILGEDTQLGCNSVTNPGTVLGCNSTVWPNVTVTGIHSEQSIHR